MALELVNEYEDEVIGLSAEAKVKLNLPGAAVSRMVRARSFMLTNDRITLPDHDFPGALLQTDTHRLHEIHTDAATATLSIHQSCAFNKKIICLVSSPTATSYIIVNPRHPEQVH